MYWSLVIPWQFYVPFSDASLKCPLSVCRSSEVDPCTLRRSNQSGRIHQPRRAVPERPHQVKIACFSFSLSYEIRLYFQPGFKLSYMNTQKALPLLSVRCTSGLFIIQFIGYSSTEIWWARTCPQYICNIFCSQFAFGKTKKNTEMLKSTKFVTLSFI